MPEPHDPSDLPPPHAPAAQATVWVPPESDVTREARLRGVHWVVVAAERCRGRTNKVAKFASLRAQRRA